MTTDQLENVVTRLEQVVVETSVQSDRNAEDIGKLTGVVANLADRLDAKTAPNWGVIISGMAVVLVMIGMAGALVKSHIDSAKNEATTYIKSNEASKQLLENIVLGELRAKAKNWDDFVFNSVSGNAPAPIVVPAPAKTP